MNVRRILIFLIIAGIFSIFGMTIAQKETKADLTTARDWIGLFSVGANDAQTDTVGGNSWKYAGTCTQTAGQPQIASNSGCNFTMPSNPGAYELRMYGNDSTTAMLDQSKVIWTQFNVSVATSGGCAATPYVQITWPALSNVSSINVYRDGLAYPAGAGLAGTATSFTDSPASTGDHTYQIQAVSSRDTLSNGSHFSENTVSVSLCTSPATGCPGNSNTNVRLNSGFLTTSKSAADAQSIFSQTGTSIFCITGERAAIPQFDIPTYEEMKSIYFDQAIQTSIVKQEITGNATVTDLNAQSSASLLHVAGNLDIDNSNLFPTKIAPAPVVIFVDGNLNINKNISYGSTSDLQGLAFVVKGNINVDPTVTSINAMMITFDQFCSAVNASGSCNATVTSNNQLTINGSVISLATDSARQPKFVRNLASGNDTTPAEKVVYQPKYMVLFKDIFSRDLLIWNELVR